MPLKYIDLQCPKNHIVQWCLYIDKWYYRFVKFIVLADEDQGEYYVRKIDWSDGTPWVLHEDI